MPGGAVARGVFRCQTIASPVPAILLILNDLLDSAPEILAWLHFGSSGFVLGFVRSQFALAFGRPLILRNLRVARRDLTLAFGFVLASFLPHLIDSKASLGSFCEISLLSEALEPWRKERLGPSAWASIG